MFLLCFMFLYMWYVCSIIAVHIVKLRILYISVNHLLTTKKVHILYGYIPNSLIFNTFLLVSPEGLEPSTR